MFYNEKTTDPLLNVETFIDTQTWYEVLKLKVDEALSTIKGLTKLTYITEKPKMMCELIKCLEKARNDILNATVVVRTEPTAPDNAKDLLSISNDHITSNVQVESGTQVIDTEQSAIACESQDTQVNETK